MDKNELESEIEELRSKVWELKNDLKLMVGAYVFLMLMFAYKFFF